MFSLYLSFVCWFCFFPILLYLRTEVKVLISCSSDVSNPVSIRQLNERSCFWSLIAGSERIQAVLILRRGALTKSYKETTKRQGARERRRRRNYYVSGCS